MKNITLLISLSLFFCGLWAKPGTPNSVKDNVPKGADVVAEPAIYPNIDRMFFNQDYVFELKGCEDCQITEVEFADGIFNVVGKNVNLSVSYANFAFLNSYLKITARDKEGKTLVLVDKPIHITQKYRYAEDEEFDEAHFFRFDEKVINIEETLSKEELLGFKNFAMNEAQYERQDMKMAGFDLRFTKDGKTVSLHSTNSSITPEMKAVINKLQIGDEIEIGNIKSTYLDNGQAVPLNSNYVVKITVGNVG